MKGKILLCTIFSCLLLSCLNSQSVYTEKEMETLPRQELMVVGEKVFYLIADAPIGEFTRKAQIFTVNDGKYTVYMTVKGSVVKSRDGSVYMNYGSYRQEDLGHYRVNVPILGISDADTHLNNRKWSTNSPEANIILLQLNSRSKKNER